MARTRGRFIRPAPKTRVWIGTGVGSTTVVASAIQVVGSLNAAALLLRPFTILRTRMIVLWESDQSTSSERPQGDLGLIVVTDTATSIGSTAIPDPSSVDGDANADWFVHQPMVVSHLLKTAVGYTSPTGQHYTVDSKAMRKVGPQDDIAIMVSETGGVGAILVTRGRMLIQLH